MGGYGIAFSDEVGPSNTNPPICSFLKVLLFSLSLEIDDDGDDGDDGDDDESK